MLMDLVALYASSQSLLHFKLLLMFNMNFGISDTIPRWSQPCVGISWYSYPVLFASHYPTPQNIPSAHPQLSVKFGSQKTPSYPAVNSFTAPPVNLLASHPVMCHIQQFLVPCPVVCHVWFCWCVPPLARSPGSITPCRCGTEMCVFC